MQNIDDYVATILTSDLTDEEKIFYLRNLNDIARFTPEQMQELEDRIYILGDKTLTEKERLTYEANFLYNHYKNNALDLTDVRKIYYKIRRITSSEDDIDNVKMQITRLQLSNGLDIRFYKSYIDLLEKMEKDNRRKTQRTFHK